jgi:hypothetical protein
MSIPEIVDLEVMSHIAQFGCIRNMDPFAQHMLKTSEHPLLRFRRTWMRQVAIQQCKEAHKRQSKINDQFKDEPVRRGASVRRAAVIDPYFMADMAKRHNASWNDKEFIGSVKEGNPAIFPRRT